MKHFGHALKYAGLRAGFVLVMAGLFAVPIYGPFMGGLEGRFFPVNSGISIVSQKPLGDGLEIVFEYTKFRQCEFVGADVSQGGKFVMFFPVNGRALTRGLGEQMSREWYVGTKSLAGLEIWFSHRCGPLWITRTLVLENS